MKLPTALPMLSGRGLRLYRYAWFVMLALAVAGITAGTWTMFDTRAGWDRSFYGAGLRVTSSNGEATVSPIGSAASASAFAPGSKLLAIDGRPISVAADDASLAALAKALEGPDGTELRLTVRSPAGAEAVHRVVRGPHHLAEADRSAPMGYRARNAMRIGLLVFTGMAMILASILLFRRRAGDPVVALLSIGLLTLLANFAAHLIPDFAIAAAVSEWLSVGGIVVLLLGMTVFPTGRFEPRWSLLALPLLAVGASRALWPDRLEWLPRAAMALTVMLMLAAIARRYRLLPPGAQRQQIKWAVLGFAGFAVVWLSGLVVTLVDERVADNRLHFALLILGTLTLALSYLLLVLGLMVSLLRYRLYDADAAISRSAAYASLTLALVAVFAGTEKLVEALGQQYFGGSAGAASGAVAAGLAALMLVPLHKRLTDWAERRFQGGLVRLRRDLPALAEDLRETASPSELSDATLGALSQGVRASRAAALIGKEVQAVRDVSAEEVAGWLEGAALDEAVEELDCDRSDPLFPMRVPLRVSRDAAPIGWVLLGPRPDGSFYGKDEQEALAEIARPLARAVRIARIKDEQQRRQDRAIARLNRELADLRRDMARHLAPPSASAAE